jgi:hypothetical protein
MKNMKETIYGQRKNWLTNSSLAQQEGCYGMLIMNYFIIKQDWKHD